MGSSCCAAVRIAVTEASHRSNHRAASTDAAESTLPNRTSIIRVTALKSSASKNCGSLATAVGSSNSVLAPAGGVQFLPPLPNTCTRWSCEGSYRPGGRAVSFDCSACCAPTSAANLRDQSAHAGERDEFAEAQNPL